MRAVFMSLCFVCVMAASAAETKSLLEREPDGWVNMMPPKDLAGWKRVPLEPLSKDPVWVVSEDGKVLTINGFSAKEMLLTEQQYGDGTFHVEWRLMKEKPGQKMLNGGIYVRTLDNKNWVQAQTAYVATPPRNGDLFSEYMSGDKKERREILNKDAIPEKPVEEWNVFEVTCKGKEVSLWFNGADRVSWPECPIEKGSLGFQSEYATMEIRVALYKAAK